MKFLTPIKIIAILALIASFGMALWSLIAPLGVWLSLWDFRQGFDLLRKAHDSALWVAGIALAIAVIVFIVGVKFPKQRLTKFAVLIVVGSGLASLGFFIPETFRAPEGQNYPPIHDISTNTENPPQFVDVLPLRADAANTTVYGGSPDMTPEKLADLQLQAYPDIQPWTTTEPKQAVFDKALQAVESLGWELVAQNIEDGRIEATDTTFWFRFKDDIIIKISENNGETTVNARSVSRVGRGDVGANAKRLRKFFTLLSDN